MQNTNLTITQTGSNQHGYQTVHPDYTGIYFFCGTVFILTIIFYFVCYKISEKWRIDHLKIKQQEISNSCLTLLELNKNIKILSKQIKEVLCGNNNNNNNE